MIEIRCVAVQTPGMQSMSLPWYLQPINTAHSERFRVSRMKGLAESCRFTSGVVFFCRFKAFELRIWGLSFGAYGSPLNDFCNMLQPCFSGTRAGLHAIEA